MSSHREAPEISKDPVADSTDLYAFVSPDEPDTVTIIANYVPLEGPDGGPNFYEFGDDVLYAISIDNDNDGDADIVYQFRFQTTVEDPDTFLYNTGPIASLTDPNWNRRQSYTVTRVDNRGGRSRATVLGSGLACPPCNIGPLSTPNYAALAQAAVHLLGGGARVFAGQRAEGFYVDLGSIFDLGILRPFEQDHTTFGLSGTGLGKMAAGVNATKHLNVHSIAIQVPVRELTANGGAPGRVSSPNAVIGVWTSAYRQKVHIHDDCGDHVWTGPYVQVSRLGNPLVNEVLIPMGKKDYWNAQAPGQDSQFAPFYTNPQLAQLLPALYPGVFPNLEIYNKATPNRADLVAILLTGIPAGLIPGFQNFTGSTQADLLRLNMAIPPAASPANTGLLGNDPAGFPNGRRVFDDVVTIELRAVAGAVLGLVDSSFTPDGAAGAIHQGLTTGPSDVSAMGTENYLPAFPYLGVPSSGFDTPAA
ncbi:MAG TPA: DUF4331 domain-containing protein [Acidimicrobiales bacterium]|nr:DUF4331 domain-containing protein [Acidimicrobiales bacterium]